jgi:hypothetical protein
MSTRKTDRPSVFSPTVRAARGEQQHQVGMLGARGPDLLAVDDVFVSCLTAMVRIEVSVPAVARSRRTPAAGSSRHLRQILLLLRVAAGVGVPMMYICAWQAAPFAPPHFLENGGGSDAEPRAAVVLESGRRTIPPRQRARTQSDSGAPGPAAPVFHGKGRAQPGDGVRISFRSCSRASMGFLSDRLDRTLFATGSSVL